MTSDSLGDRMKTYEVTSQNHLLRRMPVIIRIDGRAFHTFTKCLKHLDPSVQETPFSIIMHKVMVATTDALVNKVQGCVLGYTQSDEISLVLKDWETLESQPWFGNNVQKIVSLSAVIASNAFNHHFREYRDQLTLSDYAEFDSRTYNLPREEVTNYLLWRQNDASRNSVQMLGRFYFSQREMLNKSNSQVQEMLMLQHQVNWNNLPTWMKRGSCVICNVSDDPTAPAVYRDENIPIFSQDRQYVERFLLSAQEREAQVVK